MTFDIISHICLNASVCQLWRAATFIFIPDKDSSDAVKDFPGVLVGNLFIFCSVTSTNQSNVQRLWPKWQIAFECPSSKVATGNHWPQDTLATVCYLPLATCHSCHLAHHQVLKHALLLCSQRLQCMRT